MGAIDRRRDIGAGCFTGSDVWFDVKEHIIGLRVASDSFDLPQGQAFSFLIGYHLNLKTWGII